MRIDTTLMSANKMRWHVHARNRAGAERFLEWVTKEIEIRWPPLGFAIDVHKEYRSSTETVATFTIPDHIPVTTDLRESMLWWLDGVVSAINATKTSTF